MRKRVTVLSVLAALFTVGVLFLYLYPGNPESLKSKDDFEIVAHRGVHTNWEKGTYDLATGCEAKHIYKPETEYIENTLDSIRAAFDYGATIVEIDIRRTKDDRLVILHDYDLTCRTDGEGEVEDHDLEYLRSLDIGYGYTYDDGESYPFRGKGIGLMPTFEDIVETFPEGRFLIDHKDRETETIDILVEILDDLDSDRKDDFYFWGSPEGYDYLHGRIPEIKRLFPTRPEMKRCLLPYELSGGLGGFSKECSGLGMAMKKEYTKYFWGWPYRFLKKAEQNDSDMYFFVDSVEDAEYFEGIPVDGIVTDYIEVIGPYYITND